MTTGNYEEPNWVEAERSRIDLEIAQLEMRLKELRSRRNALAPVFRLPPEVLSRIMMDYQSDLFNEEWRDTDPSRLRLVSWTAIMQVSQHWRTVALGYAPLWNVISIPAMSRQWVAHLLVQSRAASLSLYIHCPIESRYWKDILPTLEGSLSRVSLLYFVGGSRHWYSAYTLDALSRSPLKRFVAVRGSDLYKDWGLIPSLRSLRLEQGALNLALIPRGLIKLVIVDPNTKDMPSLETLYNTLSSLTNLQSLVLERVLSRCAGTMDGTNITMPTLSSLTLRDDPENECFQFLSHVDCPELIHLNISVAEKSPTSLSQLSDIIPTFMSNTPLYRSSRAPALYINVTSNMRTTVRALNSRYEDIISLSWTRNSDLDTHFLTNLISKLPFNTLRNLGLHWSLPRALPALSSCSSLLAGVKVLTFASCSSLNDSVPSCQCVENAQTEKTEPEKPSNALLEPAHACSACREFAASVFPNLLTLKFEVNHLKDNSLNLALLKRFLKHRSNCGRPLTEVIIKCHRMEKGPEVWEMLRSLREVISVSLYINFIKHDWSSAEKD